MARMIPAHMDTDTVSKAEQRVFGMLKSDSATQNWVVLHSLGLARRLDGPYGEIDFVVIAPSQGIICLEVKGGRLSCQDGVWRTMDRYGIRVALKKSPFLQARSGMFAMKKSILQHFGQNADESHCPIGCAVVFPDVPCPPLTPEFERSDVIDIDDLRNPISKSILRVVKRRMQEFQSKGRPRQPTNSEVNSISQFLRPNFEIVVARSVSIKRTEERLLHLTQEQYTRLDELEANPRCLFEGAAGTGKTLIALEHARRVACLGSSVLLVCFNRLLGERLTEHCTGLNITVGNWHAIVRRYILASSVAEEFKKEERRARKQNDVNKLFGDLFPLFGAVAIEEAGAQFDDLVIDEAQDFASPQFFNFFDFAVRGGLSGGRWAIFGDFTQQAIYSNSVDPREILTLYSENFVRAKLTLNCRNTKRIAKETTILAGFERPPYRLGEIMGLSVEHRYWSSRSNLVESLTQIIETLIREKVSIDDIVILSFRRLEKSNLAGIDRISCFALVDCTQSLLDTKLDAVRFSTVHSFKGLESRVVIILDVDEIEGEQRQSLLYTAMSRARSLLILMIHKRLRKAVESRIKTALERELSGE